MRKALRIAIWSAIDIVTLFAALFGCFAYTPRTEALRNGGRRPLAVGLPPRAIS